MTLFALSVRQPWAYALLHLGKDIENRDWRHEPRYVGPLIVHAGKAKPTRDDIRTVETIIGREVPLEELITGAFLGAVMLDRAHGSDDCRTPKSYVPGTPFTTCSPWGEPFAGYHLPVSEPRPFREPVPGLGQLGFWRPAQLTVSVLADVMP